MALRKCKDCNHEISKSAKSCPQCGAPIKKTSLFTWVVTIFVVLIMIGQFTGNDTATSKSTPVTTKPLLAIVSWSCNVEHGYYIIVGEVKNISSNKMANVMAVGDFVTASGDMVKTEQALITYNPILPEQVSPFKVMATENPQIENCKLSFKEMFGGQILTKNK